MKWTNDQLNELKINYDHYVSHRKEAEIYFGRKLQTIKTKFLKISIFNKSPMNMEQVKEVYINNKKLKVKFTEEQLKDLKERYYYYLEHKDEAEKHFQRDWFSIYCEARKLKISSMKINKKCGVYLGCYVAERLLSYVFVNVERMPYGNKGYDFICNKGFKIDVKSSCIHKNNTYTFAIKKNKIADYFLCITFNSREDLNPQHIWLISSDDVINNKRVENMIGIVVPNNVKSLSKYSKYELTDKLKETRTCCDTLKNNKGETA